MDVVLAADTNVLEELMLNGLDLFSGISGISLALSPWVKTVAYCENDRHAQAILLYRMATRQLDYAPIWDDVNTLEGFHLPDIDIISGGFPCQDISHAGLGAGLEGKRSGLFFEIIRLTDELRPRFVFLENVTNITRKGLDRVVLEFTKIGYDCRWTCLSASEVGAKHRRERWFLLAHPNSYINKCQVQDRAGVPQKVESILGENYRTTRQSSRAGRHERGHTVCGHDEADWVQDREPQPTLGGMANDVPFGLDRIKRLGNAVVPKQARAAFKELMGLNRSTK